MDEKRVGWLDGLRGLAAVQVVLLHYATAFLPGLGQLRPGAIHYAWEGYFISTPLFFLLDGYTAVYVFFLLSGAAMTYSFCAQPLAVGPGFGRRLVRLGLPMAAAVGLGAGLLCLMPTAHVEAAARTGSEGWLGAISAKRVTAGGVLHQVALDGMVAGYRETTLLPVWLTKHLALKSLAVSFNAPLWTLHVEFLGSVLILLLVAFQFLAGRKIHGLVCGLLCVVLATNPLILFVLGHLAAPMLARFSQGRWAQWVGAVCLVVGICMCGEKDWVWVGRWLAMLPVTPLGPPMDLAQFQGMMGAVLVFTGVACLPAVQHWLAGPVPRWLGRISFSLYLVHFPLLFTASSALLVWALGRMSYGAAITTVTVAGVAASLVVAGGFEHWVDRPAIGLSRRLGAAMGRRSQTTAAISP